jgi:hypothetical protein
LVIFIQTKILFPGTDLGDARLRFTRQPRKLRLAGVTTALERRLEPTDQVAAREAVADVATTPATAGGPAPSGLCPQG